ncbi:hypothetical protein COLU111180_12185 [Cohnella lubricantis]|uniref:Uncharacterized protein n=1 Tax=Cohnella lubricantis TaxID=2163172 RepID=A0A841TBX3_9BACL|nr:hypothetical protein [Cohnella lubricantis]MBB6675941.1 hypothetical protein [Cohnella lubricantis]MBP2117942.1 hypothetical protein [Cohnella lubricantis]
MTDQKFDPAVAIDALIEIFTAVPQLYEENDAEVERRDYEHSDLTHVVELLQFGGVQGYKLAMQIKENRLRRREAKDQNFIMKPLYELVKQHQNWLPRLHKIRDEIQKNIRVNQERRYRPRSDNELVRSVIGQINNR